MPFVTTGVGVTQEGLLVKIHQAVPLRCVHFIIFKLYLKSNFKDRPLLILMYSWS